MRRSILFLLVVFVLCQNLYAAHISVPFLKGSVEIIDSTEASAMLGKDDGYPKLFSLFDIQSRLKDTTATKWKGYLSLAEKDTQNWTTEEQEAIKKAFGEIEIALKNESLHFNLPDKIYLIKSNTKEEFGAEGYTRGSSIILNPSSQPINTHLVAHELFHVFSRFNEKTRDELYHVFGFKKCNPIALTKALDNKNITNPDCPVVSHYITVNGQDMTLLLYSNDKYEGGNVFLTYAKIGFVMLSGDDTHKSIMLKGSKPVIKELEDVPEAFNQIGKNSQYLLHPEELCAEHFAAVITNQPVNQPEFVDKFKDVLKQ
ncbi:MAG: DUF4157 domain-containing protein [Bacteroidetes bacterium]|nr:DUF4157 domain-containing protein [Bacteroidota bacterium]